MALEAGAALRFSPPVCEHRLKRLVFPALIFTIAALVLLAVMAWHAHDTVRAAAAIDAARSTFDSRDQGVAMLRDLESLKRETRRAELVRGLIARVQQDVELDASISQQLGVADRLTRSGPWWPSFWLAGFALLVAAACFLRIVVFWRGERHRTERAEESLRSMRSLLAAAPMAFIGWKRGRGVVLWSDSAERMFGLERARALGSAMPEFLLPLTGTVEESLDHADAVKGLQLTVRNERGESVYLSVSANRMDLQESGAPTIAAVVEDITPHREREGRRLDALRAQRDALIREVHHRIKNHLQGVAGLLRQHLAGKPLLQPLLESATAQVLTIAAVHGLQGELRGRALDMRSMVSRIAASISGIMHVPIVLGDTCAELEGLCVAEEEAVAIAMVLNEVLMNAVKHRVRNGGETLIRVGARRTHGSVEIRIVNPGFLPPRFNFAMGAQVGTGLGLVKSLLPPEGAALDIQEEGDMVVATLTISSPLLSMVDAVGCGESGEGDAE